LDTNKDGFVSAEEILDLQSSEIERVLTPGLLPEADEEEEEDPANEEKEGSEESPVDKIIKAENKRAGIKEDL
jgi:hypothetical protein